MRLFCLKHLKNEMHAFKMREEIASISLDSLSWKHLKKRDTRLRNEIGMNFGDNFLPLLMWARHQILEAS